jgi:hypothetical protein
MLAWIFASLLVLTNVVTAAYLYKFTRIVLNVQDAVEESLDVIDKRYISISKVLQIPLFYDSPEIKRVHEDIKASRDSLLYIANLIGKVEEESEVSNEG